MNKYTIISSKISKREWEEIKKLKLNPTMIIRKAVQDEIKKAKNNDLIGRMEKIRPIISKLSKEEIVSDFREDREG